MCEQMCKCVQNKGSRMSRLLVLTSVFIPACAHQACCSTFLFSSLPPWQNCCCSAHLTIINIDAPTSNNTHTHKHSLPNVTTSCLSSITTFFNPALQTSFSLSEHCLTHYSLRFMLYKTMTLTKLSSITFGM